MKRTITHADRLQVADWLLEGREGLDVAKDREGNIAITFGISAIEDQRALLADIITDAMAIRTTTVDDLLAQLGIRVDEDDEA